MLLAAPTNRFVGAATVPTAPTNHFSTKKIKFTIQIRPEHIFFIHNSIMTYLRLRLTLSHDKGEARMFVVAEINTKLKLVLCLYA